MNKQELENKIAVQKLYVADCKEDLRTYLIALEMLEAELAEAEKPELRHGDYGWDRGSRNCITLKVAGKEGLRQCIESEGLWECAVDKCGEPTIVLGNIFDDFKAIAEDLEEFDMDLTGCESSSHIRVQFEERNSGIIAIRTEAGTWAWMTMDEFAVFILNLRGMQATQKRKERKAK